MNIMNEPKGASVVSPALRIRQGEDNIMLDVIIALMPALAAGIWFFGYRAGLVVLISVATAVATEWSFCKLFHRKNTVRDLSAIVSGLILAFNMPPTVPLWIPAVGSIFMIIIIKMVFGGLGNNFVNPAAAARIFLVTSWPAFVTKWVVPGSPARNLKLLFESDLVSAPTPLSLLKDGMMNKLPKYMDLYMGNVAGCIGEVCVVALIFGGLYLVFRKVISWKIPVIYIGTVFLLTWSLGADPVYSILSGGLMLGAIFMATDHTTSPVNSKAKIIYAIMLGCLTVLFRFKSSMAEGICYSILIMNVVVPFFDKVFPIRQLGKIKAEKGEDLTNG